MARGRREPRRAGRLSAHPDRQAEARPEARGQAAARRGRAHRPRTLRASERALPSCALPRVEAVAFAVADAYQQRGIGSALTDELIADARAAGITHVTALVAGDNPAALALLRRALEVLDIRFEGTELSIRAAIS